jgi:hypothetical protein
MFYCNKCKTRFPEAKTTGIHGSPDYSRECPHCGSEDYIDEIYCEECQEWQHPDAMTICPNCNEMLVCKECAAKFAGCCGEDCQTEYALKEKERAA